MNYNQSLDDIIKFSKSNNSGKKNRFESKPRQRRPKSGKNEKKLPVNNFQKFNSGSFKSKIRRKGNKKLPISDARLKISGIADARFKILQNKNRLGMNSKPRISLLPGKNNVIDARLKIEAHKQKKLMKLESPSRGFSVTRLAPDGIIERRINTDSLNDNGVYVEYEDDNMDLEYEDLKKNNWSDSSLMLRRTIQNLQKRRSALKTSNMLNDRCETPISFYRDNEDDNLPLREVTRTISNANIKKQPLSTSRRSYSKKDSPVHQLSYSDDDEMRQSRSSPSHPSPMLREPAYHLIVISNLHENVTGEDIKELFEDVGDLVYAKMIRSGVAEVAYKSQKDAVKAVEIYHNRQLDGLPMKCALLSSSSEPSSSRYIPPVNISSSVAPDTRIIKKALFSSR